MSEQNNLLNILKFISNKENLAKIEYDIDKLHPKPFTQPEHYYALIAGAFCIGISIILMFFIR